MRLESVESGGPLLDPGRYLLNLASGRERGRQAGNPKGVYQSSTLDPDGRRLALSLPLFLIK